LPRCAQYCKTAAATKHCTRSNDSFQERLAFARHPGCLIEGEAMSAKIYYLRPLQRQNPDAPAVEPQAEDEHPQASPASPVGKRPVRSSLPGGRNSKWKRKLGGGAVRRDARVDDKGSPSEE
jgi:hypothetical protein